MSGLTHMASAHKPASRLPGWLSGADAGYRPLRHFDDVYDPLDNNNSGSGNFNTGISRF